MSDDRVIEAYNVFRNGFQPPKDGPLPWGHLLPWIRDALRVAYMQGRLDGAAQSQVSSRATETNE